MSDNLNKAVSLPGIIHTINLMPVVPADACKDPAKLHALGEQNIAGYEKVLDELLPMIDTASDIEGQKP